MLKEVGYWGITGLTAAGGGFLENIDLANLPASVVIAIGAGFMLTHLIKTQDGKLERIRELLEKLVVEKENED